MAKAKTEPTFEITKSDAEWRQRLTPEQYRVLREHGTEHAGSSPLDKEHGKGTFLCAGCELALFSSDTKFDSGTGWPSFYAPVGQRGGHHVGPELLHDTHRGALPALRRPPGPCLRRRSAAYRPALLHERRRAQIRPGVTRRLRERGGLAR